MDKPELKLSVFSDYICPFCYIGHHRLEKLREDYTLKINWCLVEIHPDTPVTGVSADTLGYSSEEWQQLMGNLKELLAIDQLPFKKDHDLTTNSHQALLLAEACKPLGPELFYRVHNRLFDAFFVDGLNIGDEDILRTIAADCAIPDDVINPVFHQQEELEQHLKLYLQFASQAGIRGVPTVLIGEQSFSGVVGLDTLRQAAEQATN